jgi:hypothetical protein
MGLDPELLTYGRRFVVVTFWNVGRVDKGRLATWATAVVE